MPPPLYSSTPHARSYPGTQIRTEQAKADSIVADASAVRLFQRREEQIKMLQKK